MKPSGGKGFTLVETLVALSLVGAVLLPASLWLYPRTGAGARQRFRATQLLEMEMNRALLLRRDKEWSEEIPDPGYLRLEIHAVRDGTETRLLGSAQDRKGRMVVQLQAGFFEAKP